MTRAVRVEVPASSANLGPGFDVLAVALGLLLTVEVVETGEFRFVTDLNLRRDRENLIVRAFERLLPADSFEFRVSSTIPLSGGLGSSAAGVVAGLLAADHFTGGGADVLALATEIEGHPDNVAASLYGGLVICDGTDVERIDMPAELEAVLVIPGRPVRTALAREAIPAQVPIADAIHNLAQIAKLAARPGNRGLGSDRGRPERSTPPAPPGTPLSALRGDSRASDRVRRARSHHLRCGAGCADLVPQDPERPAPLPALMRWLAEIKDGWAEVRIVQFERNGASVSPV